MAKKPKAQPFARQNPDSPPSLRQQRFVDEYLIDLHSVNAAIRAGYSAKSANNTAHKLMRLPWVRKAISEAADARAARTNITQDMVLTGLARIAFGDLRKMFDANGTLRPIHDLDDETAGMLAGVEVDTSTEAGRDGESITTTRTSKVRRADQIKALELLGKHLSMFKDQVEHTGNVSFVIER